MTNSRIGRTLVTLAVGLLPLAGCSDSAGIATGDSVAAAGGPGSVAGPITVFAAASLTESFTKIGRDFTSANPKIEITFNFASSSTLANQVNQGAPADVFAAASQASMKTVTEAGNAGGPPVTVAGNRLVIAVPRGNPKGVTGLADLVAPGMKVALCAEQVPCGAAAKQAMAAAKITLTPVTLEPDVKATLTKVRLGEVDAALVYRTDVNAAAVEVDGIEFPEAGAAVNDCPMVVVRNSQHAVAARAFVGYVQSAAGQAVLSAAGFQVP